MVTQRKLFLGARLKRLRRDLGLQQGAMAGDLGISASYLNHLERNQRPVTAGILLRLAESFDIDIKSFAAEGRESAGVEQLSEIFSDRMFADLGVSRYDLVELADNSPAVADGVARLYTALREMQRRPGANGEIGDDEAPDPRGLLTPETWVRDFIQESNNHFPELEECAETLGVVMADALSIAEPLRRRLKDAWGITARVVPQAQLGGATQQYDPERRVLELSSLLRSENRTFGLAYQLAMIEFREVLERLVAAAVPPDQGSRHLLHMSLANYAAGAIIMPYGRFLASTAEQRYSIDRLCGEYGANVEQVAHRLTTLGRPGASGVPFFMIRVDAAGNISKRYAGNRFPFSRFGGTCPRWNLHAAFQNAGKAINQVIETPDGQRFFTISRTIERPIQPDLRSDGLLAIGLGCELKYAERLHCAEGIDLANPPITPIGPACAICPRLECPQRATAPAGRTLAVEENRKTISPYPFLPG